MTHPTLNTTLHRSITAQIITDQHTTDELVTEHEQTGVCVCVCVYTCINITVNMVPTSIVHNTQTKPISYKVVYCGTLWYTVVHCGILWYIVVYCGTLWYIVVYYIYSHHMTPLRCSTAFSTIYNKHSCSPDHWFSYSTHGLTITPQGEGDERDEGDEGMGIHPGHVLSV